MPLAWHTFEQACECARLLVRDNGFRYRIFKNKLGYWEVARAGRGKRK